MNTTVDARSESEILHNISRVVRMLMAYAEIGQNELGEALGMDSATISKSLSGQRRWTVADLARLGAIFDRPPGFFFEPAEDLIRNRCLSLFSLAA